MQRKASATWNGDLKKGHGRISTASGVLAGTQYSFSTRFEDGKGTNPEELIAAAHAGCFSMALSAQLSGAGLPPNEITTEATVTLDKVDGGWAVTKSHLEVSAKIPNADAAKFHELADAAKSGCPISKLLKAEITMNAVLVGDEGPRG
jgi:lipoyl-dependent peroxiredoxin